MSNHLDYNYLMLRDAILQQSNEFKQKKGIEYAKAIGFHSGPRGPDNGVDGAIINNHYKLLAHFQCKLFSSKITIDEAKKYHSDLIRLSPQLSIYLSGVGYDESFINLICASTEINKIETKIYLLDLYDVIAKTDRFTMALHAVTELEPFKKFTPNWNKFAIPKIV